MGKTNSKPLAARDGRGTAWAGHGKCEESAFNVTAAVKVFNMSFCEKELALFVTVHIYI
jgi:hypothetical protein